MPTLKNRFRFPDHLAEFSIPPNSTIREAIACIDGNGEGIAIVVGEDYHLIGTVTDGDVRRAILAGVDLDSSVQRILDEKLQTSRPTPLTAHFGMPEAELLRLMNKHMLRHVPLVDPKGRVLGVALLSQLAKEYEAPMSAMVMAGGYGTRLRPLTEDLPKPMLPVGGRPLLERIIEQLRVAGIRRLNLATHYKKDVIKQHFGDGHDFGVDIHYVEEDRPMGTAGAIKLLEASDEPLLVINGDILTRVDFRAMLDFHHEQQAEMTVAVRPIEYQLYYGLVQTNGALVTGIVEKPLIRHFINAGIYLLSPDTCRYIPEGQSFDMPDLIVRLLSEDRRVVSFPVREYWLDIGQHADYEQAQADARNDEV